MPHDRETSERLIAEIRTAVQEALGEIDRAAAMGREDEVLSRIVQECHEAVTGEFLLPGTPGVEVWVACAMQAYSDGYAQ